MGGFVGSIGISIRTDDRGVENDWELSPVVHQADDKSSAGCTTRVDLDSIYVSQARDGEASENHEPVLFAEVLEGLGLVSL